uniref:DSPn domain-containing protein n=1 Tax=Macrostomum lignano TaxID=282301 RepID=A0A1I8FKQ9_9PLAT
MTAKKWHCASQVARAARWQTGGRGWLRQAVLVTCSAAACSASRTSGSLSVSGSYKEISYFHENQLVYRSPSNQLDNRLLISLAASFEHDKNPDSFFTAIFALADSGRNKFCSFVCRTAPPAFEAAKKRLPSDQIAHWGYLENRQVYLACLSACHVVVSTAEHEFFWFSHARSHIRRLLPLAPRRLAYPELFPSEFLCLFVQAYCLMLQGTLAPETVCLGWGCWRSAVLAYLFCASGSADKFRSVTYANW